MISDRESEYQERKRALVRKAKDVPCSVCGKRYHFAAMDFHHRDRTHKKFTVATAVFRHGIETLRQEIAKCDVICSNCHRIQTYTYSDNKAAL